MVAEEVNLKRKFDFFFLPLFLSPAYVHSRMNVDELNKLKKMMEMNRNISSPEKPSE